MRDVTRRLLEVRHEAPPLQDLREHVGRLLAGEVDTAELRHRIVAVFDEHFLVELLHTLESDRGVDAGVTRDVELPDELVEEEPAQVLGRAGVAGEECSLDDFRQVDQGKDRLVQVGHVAAKDGLFVGREPLFGVFGKFAETVGTVFEKGGVRTRECGGGKGQRASDRDGERGGEIEGGLRGRIETRIRIALPPSHSGSMIFRYWRSGIWRMPGRRGAKPCWEWELKPWMCWGLTIGREI